MNEPLPIRTLFFVEPSSLAKRFQHRPCLTVQRGPCSRLVFRHFSNFDVVFEDLLHERQSFIAIQAVVALGRLSFQGIEHIDIQAGQRRGEHAKEIRANFAKELGGKLKH